MNRAALSGLAPLLIGLLGGCSASARACTGGPASILVGSVLPVGGVGLVLARRRKSRVQEARFARD